jgi:hypothetical protein
MFLPALALQPEPFSAFSTPQRAVSLQAILHGTRNPTVSTSNVHVIELSQGCRTAVELLFKRTLNVHRPVARVAADRPFLGAAYRPLRSLKHLCFVPAVLP